MVRLALLTHSFYSKILICGTKITKGTSDKELDKLISYDCRTKEDVQTYTSLLIEHVIKRQEKKPLYPFFVEHFARELALPLKDGEVRKVASTLGVLANEKQREAKDKASGKKSKAAAKPALAGTKATAR